MTRQYIFTERAHLMCPNMCFGIAETILHPFDSALINQTCTKLSEAHPFLKAVLGYEKETNRYFYEISASHKIEIILHKEEITALNKETILAEYQRLTSRDWDLRTEGMLKAVFWNLGNKTYALFVFHHLLADGRAAQSLSAEFAKAYACNKKCIAAAEKLISNKNELPELPFFSRVLIGRCNKNWRKENHTVTYEEYHKFAEDFLQTDTIIHQTADYSETELQKIIAECKKNEVSVNDYLLAKTMLEENTDKIIIAKDIRSRLECYNANALGNYSTAMSVFCKTKTNEIWQKAQAVHNAVQKLKNNIQAATTVLSCYALMEPGLIDAVAISTLGGWQSKTGAFVGGAMFGYKSKNGISVTNLGAFTEQTIENAMFIPPASPAMKKTFGILTVNGKMSVCTSERI